MAVFSPPLVHTWAWGAYIEMGLDAGPKIIIILDMAICRAFCGERQMP